MNSKVVKGGVKSHFGKFTSWAKCNFDPNNKDDRIKRVVNWYTGKSLSDSWKSVRSAATTLSVAMSLALAMLTFIS